MKLNYFFLLLVLSMTASPLFAAPREFSEVRCRPAQQSGHCNLEWDFSATPRMRYTVEKLNPDSGRWNIIHAKDAMHLSARRPVQGGHLYRVRGCNGGSRRFATDCVSSRVVWAPVYLPEQQIPHEVIDGSGQVMTVDKSAPYEEQIEQYNVYVLVRLLGSSSVNLAELPPMAEFGEDDTWDDGEWTAAEALQHAIYLNYSGMQAIAKSRVSNGEAVR